MATQETGKKWLAALLDSDDYRARAAGLLLEGKLADSTLTVQPTAEQTRDELVQLAVGANDPAVYAMALSVCRGFRGARAGPCERLSPSIWAQLDPDNAIPWMAVAAAARARHDASAEAQALRQAAAAHKVESYTDALLEFAEPEMPLEATPLDRWYLAIETTGVAAASFPPGNLSAECSPEALGEDALRAQCNSLAELLVKKSSTLIGKSLGMTLAARLGWPAVSTAALQQEFKASLEVMREVEPEASSDSWSCDSVARGNAFLRERAELGESGAARAAVERSGESPAELADKWDAFIREAGREASRQAPQVGESASH